MRFLLDTNIIIYASRWETFVDDLNRDYQLFIPDNTLLISTVTLGELDSFAKQRNYGKKRKRLIRQLVDNITVLPINIEETIAMYGTIDAFSQGKLTNRPTKFSARNMGKNDLWIAATAAVFNLNLVTTDRDFTHLHEEFLQVNYVDIEQYR